MSGHSWAFASRCNSIPEGCPFKRFSPPTVVSNFPEPARPVTANYATCDHPYDCASCPVRGFAVHSIPATRRPGPTDRSTRDQKCPGKRYGCSSAALDDQSIPGKPFKMGSSYLQAVCALIAIAFVHSDNRLTMMLFATGAAAAVLLIAATDRPFIGEISMSPNSLLQVLPAPGS
jgi:hypothetical protein